MLLSVVASLTGTLASACGGRVEPALAQAASTPACSTVRVEDLYPTAARFAPGELVRLRAEVRTTDERRCSTFLGLRVTRHGQVVHEQGLDVTLEPGNPSPIELEWDAPDEDLRGYMAAVSSGTSASAQSTGVDVSSSPRPYSRYGFLTTFGPEETEEDIRSRVDVLAQRFHLNMFQFYDWFSRHEDLIPGPRGSPPPSEWSDLLGRVTAARTLREALTAVHDRGAFGLAYVTLYAAREGYAELSGVSPAWGLYQRPGAEDQVSLPYTGNRFLFLFDPSNPEWQRHMAEEYIDAMATFDFDGVHIDQFGPRPTLYRADGSSVELSETFAPFLERIEGAIDGRLPDGELCIFNLVDGAVDGYGVGAVASTMACDVLYSELWFRTDTYEQVRAYVEQLRMIDRSRGIILAVYPQYDEDVGIPYQAEEAGLDGVRVDTDHEGFSGSGFVDDFDQVGESVEWTVDIGEQADVTFVFRYANATGESASRTVFLDGVEVGRVTFFSRSSWADWSSDAWVQVREVRAGRHQVRLAYGEADSGAINIDRLTLGEFDEEAVRLQNAVIFASGATPILLGDDVQGLAHEYFPNRSKVLTRSLQRVLRDQLSFITAHEEILFGPSVMPIPERLERVEALSPGHRLITEGVDGIWTVLRRTPVGDVVHLINLFGVDNPRWRDPAPIPLARDGIRLRYAVPDSSAVTEVFWATPDEGLGVFEPLELTRGPGYVEMTVPRLAYWDVVLVRRSDVPGAR